MELREGCWHRNSGERTRGGESGLDQSFADGMADAGRRLVDAELAHDRRDLLLEPEGRVRHCFHFLTTTTVPRPTVDEISNSSISRLTPGRPTPSRPEVE